ncbi:MAG: CDP-alcohol phosphatidyltransferase family protein [Candidatus Scalindua sp.]
MITSALVLLADDNNDECAFLETASMPLFKRAIFSGQKAGIDKFIILYSGKKKSEIERSLSMDKRVRSEIKIIDVLNKTEDVLIDIRSAPEQNYLIIEANTFFDNNRLLQEFSQISLRDEVAAITIDKTVNISAKEHKDRNRQISADHWYVKLSNNKVSAISQGLENYDGRAAGIVLASSGIVEILIKNLFADATFSVYKLMAQQVKDGRILAFDIKDNLCVEVLSKQQLQECEKRLYNSLGSSVDGPIIDKYINRRISRVITKQLVKTHITPNQTTFLSLIIGIVSAWYFWQGGFWNYIAGGLVFQLSFIFDQCDGEIARLKFMESRIGGWFDAFCDSIIRTFIILGMTGSLYAKTNQSLILILGILSSIGIFVSTMAGSYETLKKEEEAKSENTGSANTSTANESKIGAFIDKFNNTDSFSIILFICILSGHLTWFLWTIGIGSFAFTLVILIKLIIIGKT